MSKRLLVIDRNDEGNFFLLVEGGTLTLGGGSLNAEAILNDLRIARIHCEIEVEDESLVIRPPEPSADAADQLLECGAEVRVGQSRFRLQEVAAPALSLTTGAAVDERTASAVESAITASEARLRKRLLVFDGADKGLSFLLPQAGVVTIGKNNKSAAIVLHDLYVAREHCQLEIDDDDIVVTHLQGHHGTLINGQRITKQSLRLGDVLRVGNEHLRLETVLADEIAEPQNGEATSAEDETYEVEVLRRETDDDIPVAPETVSSEREDPYALPHGPVDELRALEGQVLGHYQIGPLLGRGHSGLVFRALDVKNKQLVALKVLSPDFPGSEAELQRFVRALKQMTPLQEPHLIGLCGAGKTGPYCWLAREYVEGECVARLMQRLKAGGRFDWKRACRVAIHLSKTLRFLHQNRIAHGNLTPRNVLIRQSDQATRLADLMLNQALEGSQLQKAILGKKLLAELPYLAPEQTDPHAPGTALGDTYSLGAVLYALLTGQPPFLGTTSREVLARIREGKPTRPRELQRGIPAPFEAAVLMMMARRPEERFQSADDVLAAIEPLAAEHDVEV